jgi:hypothetical protein
MFYKFQWRALHVTPFRKKYFPKQEEIRLQNAETRVVLKDVGEENNSNNYESHKTSTSATGVVGTKQR